MFNVETGMFTKENGKMFIDWFDEEINTENQLNMVELDYVYFNLFEINKTEFQKVLEKCKEYSEITYEQHQELVDDDHSKKYIDINNNLFLSGAIEGVSFDSNKQLTIYGTNAHYTILRFDDKDATTDAYNLLWQGIVYNRYAVIGKAFVKRSRVVSTRWDDNQEMFITLKSRLFLKTIANEHQVQDFNDVMKGNSCY